MRKLILASVISGMFAQAANADLLLVAAPKGQSEMPIFQPISNFLSTALHKKVTLGNPQNFLVFEDELQKATPDIIWGGAPFVSWMIEHRGYTAVAKLPEPTTWTIIGKGQNINSVQDLIGRGVCAMAPPNIGTLNLLAKFTNPVRQPYIVPVTGWAKVYQCVVDGKGSGAIIPLEILKKLGGAHQVKILETLAPTANQSFAVSSRVSADDQSRIRDALLSPAGEKVMQGLRDKYSSGAPLVASSDVEFKNADVLLASERGFE